MMKPVHQVTVWLFRVARHRITDLFRRKNRESPRTGPTTLTEDGEVLLAGSVRVFGWHPITFWQAVGVLILSKILFGGFRGRPGRHLYWRHRMMEVGTDDARGT